MLENDLPLRKMLKDSGIRWDASEEEDLLMMEIEKGKIELMCIDENIALLKIEMDRLSEALGNDSVY